MDRAMGYARRHQEFLKEANPNLFKSLQANGQLAKHCKEIGTQAAEMYESLSAQMQTAKSLPEEYAARVAALEAIPATVDEIVMHELVLAPPANPPT